MGQGIDTIFFDIGNTLRVIEKDAAYSEAAALELMERVGASVPRDEFFRELSENYEIYRNNSKETLLDMSEMEMWMFHLLPGYPKERVAANAGKLTRCWRNMDGRRVPREGVKETIIELHARGYKLGIIANTITETEIPDWLVEDEIAEYFKSVILSSKVRIRKPNPEIYLLSCKSIGSEPRTCAYLGDNPERDIAGTRAAGFGMMIRIDEPDTLNREPPSGDYVPDHVIKDIPDMLGLFPHLA